MAPKHQRREPAVNGDLLDPTAAVSTYAYVNPVVAVSLGALFLGERPTLATLLGGAVVVFSVAMLLIRRSSVQPQR